MKYLYILFLSCFVFVSTGIAQTQKTPPKIVSSDSVIDLGTLEEGTVKDFTISISNDGGIPLVIEKILPTCGCLTTGTITQSINPQDKATYNFTFYTEGFTGEEERAIQFYSNDPVTPFLAVTIKSNINKSSYSPVIIKLGEVIIGEEKEKVQDLLFDADKDIESSSSYIKGSIQGTKIKVSYLADNKIGSFREKLILKDKSGKHVTAFLIGRKVNPIVTMPRALEFGALEGKAEQILEIRNRQKGALNDISIKVDNKAISISEMERTEIGLKYKISVDPSLMGGTLSGNINIKLENLEDPIKIPVHAIKSLKKMGS